MRVGDSSQETEDAQNRPGPRLYMDNRGDRSSENAQDRPSPRLCMDDRDDRSLENAPAQLLAVDHAATRIMEGTRTQYRYYDETHNNTHKVEIQSMACHARHTDLQTVIMMITQHLTSEQQTLSQHCGGSRTSLDNSSRSLQPRGHDSNHPGLGPPEAAPWGVTQRSCLGVALRSCLGVT